MSFKKLSTIFLCLLLANTALSIIRSHCSPANNRSHLTRITDYLLHQIHLNLGAMTQLADNPEKTLYHLSEALRLEPSSYRVRLKLSSLLEQEAMIALKRSDLETAYNLMNQLEECDPTNSLAVIFLCSWNHFHAIPVDMDRLRAIPPGAKWKIVSEIMETIILEGGLNRNVGEWILSKSNEWPTVEWLPTVAGDVFWLSGDIEAAKQSYAAARLLDSGDYYIMLRSGVLECVEFGFSDPCCQWLNLSLALNPASEYRSTISSICPNSGADMNLNWIPTIRNENEIFLSAFTGFFQFLSYKVDLMEKETR